MRMALAVVLFTVACAQEHPPQAATSLPPVGNAAPRPAVPATAAAAADASAPRRCVFASADVCALAPECVSYDARVHGDDAFWMGIHVVCGCAPVGDKTVTPALVDRELGKWWSVVTEECETDHGLVPATYLRESTGLAMPALADRTPTVQPAKEYFTRLISPVGLEKPTGKNLTIAVRLRDGTTRLRDPRWVRFADSSGGNITDFVVGFTSAGYLVGFYADGDRL